MHAHFVCVPDAGLNVGECEAFEAPALSGAGDSLRVQIRSEPCLLPTASMLTILPHFPFCIRNKPQ